MICIVYKYFFINDEIVTNAKDCELDRQCKKLSFCFIYYTNNQINPLILIWFRDRTFRSADCQTTDKSEYVTDKLAMVLSKCEVGYVCGSHIGGLKNEHLVSMKPETHVKNAFKTFVCLAHDDVIKWKHFPRYWSFVRRIHRSPVNSPHKGQ